MKILQRYITTNLIILTLLALFALVSLFSFFSIIDQLSETGKGTYGVTQALLYVLLTTPKLAYELFPIAAVIGSMTALGILAQNNELAIIRTSGVSKFSLAMQLIKAGLILILFAAIIGEVLAPSGERTAQQRRSLAQTNQITLQSKYGMWARDGSSYVNIRKILPGDRVEQVYIYEFDKEDRLRNTIYAEEGEYRDGEWLLKDIEQTTISEDGISKNRLALASWDSLFKPEMVEFILVKPEYMTIWGLFQYIEYLRKNSQETLPYEKAFWSKLIKPFSIVAMILLAIPLVNCNSKLTAVAQRVFFGAFVGIIFHIVNQSSGHMGIVYGIHPSISVTTPTVLLLAGIFLLLRRSG